MVMKNCNYQQTVEETPLIQEVVRMLMLTVMITVVMKMVIVLIMLLLTIVNINNVDGHSSVEGDDVGSGNYGHDDGDDGSGYNTDDM